MPGVTIVVPWTATPKATATPTPSLLEHSGAVNPLTGLPVQNPHLLARRPVLVKVENLPREHRPQFGLTLADIVYEYHTEEGSTRFAALFYGNNAERVGPIRSARFFDVRLIQMYKPVFVFGSAYRDLLKYLFEQDFKDRLVLEGPNTAPALYRYEPQGKNLLLLNMDELQPVIDRYGIDNYPPELDGMHFASALDEPGEPAGRVYVRYSAAIYNRWDYDPASGRYLRFVDDGNAATPQREVYVQLSDRLTDEPVAADNVVMILAENFVVTPGVFDILLTGKGEAYIARDGRMHRVFWVREEDDDVLTLAREDGTCFPFKPGQTWFEVMSIPTDVQRQDDAWRFVFTIPGEE